MNTKRIFFATLFFAVAASACGQTVVENLINKNKTIQEVNRMGRENSVSPVPRSKVVTKSKINASPYLSNLAERGKRDAETARMLERYLGYIRIESQSSYPAPGSDEFPMNEGQKRMAQHVYDELCAIARGTNIEVKMSPDYYVYVKVPSNSNRKVPSVLMMAHLDVTPEENGTGIKPQIHPNYDGGDIELGNGRSLSPRTKQGEHLLRCIGKTIVTSDGSTLTGADCKTGCAILTTLIERMASDKKFKHGDVYVCYSQNEDVGMAGVKMDMSYFDKVPDMLIDVDGSDYNQFSVANFTAEGRVYRFDGNHAHPSDGLRNGYADAHTAMAYFIGHLPPSVHPSHSQQKQGYIHCFDCQPLNDGEDYRASFRVRYFDKADSARFAGYFNEATKRTMAAFPNVKIELESNDLQYDNVANSMHPQLVNVIRKAAAKTGMIMYPVELRAGTTGAMMVAQGLPGGPCIYSGQQAEHSVYEWACIEELVELTDLCQEIVAEIHKL